MDWLQSHIRVFRTLLYCYPAEFRHEYGAEMEQLFSDRLQSESRFTLWPEALADIAFSALREHGSVLASDVKHGVRSLGAVPGFTTMAVLVLALGIGANTTMFSVVNSVLLRPLPGYQTDRLVRITNNDRRYAAGFIPPELYLELFKHHDSFETISGQQFCSFNLTGVGEPEQIWGPCTSSNWFAMQRATAFLGRTFAPDEDQRGHSRVVVLSHAFWKKKFNGSFQVIGRVIRLNDSPWTIIGVMPPDFKPIGVSDAFIFTPNVIPDNPAGLIVMARLNPFATMRGARAELQVIEIRLMRSGPRAWKGTDLVLTPAIEQLTGAQRPLLFTLMGAVCFVLLIACVNVSNLLLARSKAREQEMSIRLALGASRSRITRFLLTEVLLICSAASLIAVGVAYLGIIVLRPLVSYLPRADEIAVDGRVFVWALFIGWLATLLAGVLPSIPSARASYIAGMASRVTMKWQTALLAVEVALALVLLVGAGLLIRTFANLRNAPLGYDPSHTLTSFLAMPERWDANSAESFYGRVRERLIHLPDVQSAATASSTPAGGVDMSIEVEPEGMVPKRGAATATVDIVSPQYFRTLGIRVKTGRPFTDTDRAGGSPVAIVSESVARKYFGDKALGRRLRVPAVNFALTDARMVWAEIIGIVENVAVKIPGETSAEHIYLPEAQNPVRFTYLLVRTERNPMLVASAIRHAVYKESPTTPLDEIKSMEERSAYLTATPRRAMWLLGVFAGLAVVIAVSGIYAVSAYIFTQGMREAAIRIALGASPLSLARTICRKPIQSILAGILCGVLGSLVLTRLLNSFLFGISNIDPFTYMSAGILLLTFALIAMLKPIMYVLGTDVARTLRQS